MSAEQDRQKKVQRHAANLIEDQLGYTNGWRVSDEEYQDECLKAAKRVIAYYERQRKRREREATP